MMNNSQTGPDGWIERLFACIDRKDAEGFCTFLTKDARFVFGNQPPVEGREAVRDAVAGFFDSIAALEHRLDRVWRHGDSVICNGEVSYTRLDGRAVTLPFADIFSMEADLVSTYQIYMDVSPLFANAG